MRLVSGRLLATRTMRARGRGERHVTLYGPPLKRHLVHRLVAAAFLLMPLDSNLVIDHLDGDPSNNRLDNLEPVTVAENNRRALASGCLPTKLLPADVTRIRERVRSGERQRAVASSYQVSEATVSMIMRGKAWRNV